MAREVGVVSAAETFTSVAQILQKGKVFVSLEDPCAERGRQRERETEKQREVGRETQILSKMERREREI